MYRKRSLLPGLYGSHKRRCTSILQPNNRQDDQVITRDQIDEMKDDINSFCDTKAALLLIKGLFDLEKMNHMVPQIILQHQVYSIIKNRTKADSEVEQLRQSGEIRLFKLGSEINDICIVFSDDYIAHVEKSAKGIHYEEIVHKFVKKVLPSCFDVSVNKDLLMDKYKFTDKEISSLVHSGVLNVRDVGSWWIAIPGCGAFVRKFLNGRKAIITMLRHCKYREILQTGLEERRMPKKAPFGMMYHIYDIIGAELVSCIPTTSGILLRLNDK